jgi:mannosyltransferase OCH1-like enzyme
MKQNYEKLISYNPKMTFHLYDENDSREFIKTHFKPDVLDAYDSLIPNAYKSDLWRYCVLFINGGIYIDIKFGCVNNFRLIALTEKEHFVRDRDPPGGTLNGLLVCKPGNQILFKCIRKIVDNVQKKFYGDSALSPTGPNLLGLFSSKREKLLMPMYFENTISNGKDNHYIALKCKSRNDIIILKIYDEYREEQRNVISPVLYYSNLYFIKDIYNIPCLKPVDKQVLPLVPTTVIKLENNIWYPFQNINFILKNFNKFIIIVIYLFYYSKTHHRNRI